MDYDRVRLMNPPAPPLFAFLASFFGIGYNVFLYVSAACFDRNV